MADASDPFRRESSIEMATGTLEWLSRKRGFGYISPDAGGRDLVVHRTRIADAVYETLAVGDRVQFQHHMGERGREAVDVTRLAL